MKRNIQYFIFGYGQRVLLESAFVVLILSFLVVIQLEFLPVYVNSAKLTEPVNLSEDIQRYMMIDRAFTGKFPARSDLYIDLNDWSHSVKDFNVSPLGDVLIELNDSWGISIGKDFGFSFSENKSGKGFSFYSWTCGGSNSPNMSDSESKPVQSIYSHTVCRS